MHTPRIALPLILSALGTCFCGTASAQDAAFTSTSWATSFPAPVAEPLGEELSDEREPLHRVRVGVVYSRSIPTVVRSGVIEPESWFRDELGATNGVHATVEVPLAPALAIGARAGFRAWSVDGERAVGLSAHTTFDLGGLLVLRVPYLWSMSLENGGWRFLGVGGLSVDTLGFDDPRETATLSPRAGWHAGFGVGLEWLIAGRVSISADCLYVQRQTRVHFDIPNGAAGSLQHRTHELSLSLGLTVLL